MTGVILFRAQPFHNGHLSIVKQAFEDCRKENADLYIFVGSADKVGTERNPLSISFRLMLIKGTLRENYSSEELKHIHVIPLKDLSDETDNSYNWGRFLFMKMLRYTKDINMTIYYSDNPKIMLSWFDEEDKWCFKFKFVNRYENICATDVRKHIESIDSKDKKDTGKLLPNYVITHIKEIKKYLDKAK